MLEGRESLIRVCLSEVQEEEGKVEVEGAEVGNQMKLSMPGFPNREESKGKTQSRVRLGCSQEVRVQDVQSTTRR